MNGLHHQKEENNIVTDTPVLTVTVQQYSSSLHDTGVHTAFEHKSIPSMLLWGQCNQKYSPKMKYICTISNFLYTQPSAPKREPKITRNLNSTSTFFCRQRILYHIFFCIHCPTGLQAVHNLLPDCEVGIHGNQGLKAHCSGGDKRKEEHVSGCAFIKNTYLLKNKNK